MCYVINFGIDDWAKDSVFKMASIQILLQSAYMSLLTDR